MNSELLTHIGFILTAVISVWFLFKASGNLALFLIVPLLWMAALAVLSYQDFFKNTDAIPPKIMLAPGFSLLLILVLFISKSGQKILNKMDLKTLTWLHVIRVPVELILYLLFLQKLVPQNMTFEGSNLDILSGISAPVAAIMLFKNGRIKRIGLLIWNMLCLLLLVNIVATAILSMPTNFQQFAFDQPNTAILQFPYVWLPGVVVPIVFLAHLAAIRILVKKI